MTHAQFAAVVARARILAAERRRARAEACRILEERAAAAPAWLADLLSPLPQGERLGQPAAAELRGPGLNRREEAA